MAIRVFFSALILVILASNSLNRLLTRSIVLWKAFTGLRLKPSVTVTSLVYGSFTGVCTLELSSLEDTEDNLDLLSDSISLLCFWCFRWTT